MRISRSVQSPSESCPSLEVAAGDYEVDSAVEVVVGLRWVWLSNRLRLWYLWRINHFQGVEWQSGTLGNWYTWYTSEESTMIWIYHMIYMENISTDLGNLTFRILKQVESKDFLVRPWSLEEFLASCRFAHVSPLKHIWCAWSNSEFQERRLWLIDAPPNLSDLSDLHSPVVRISHLTPGSKGQKQLLQ